MHGVVVANGSYSVTNKAGSPQLPSTNANHANPARHSKLKGIGGSGAGTPNSNVLPQNINQSSAKMAKK